MAASAITNTRSNWAPRNINSLGSTSWPIEWAAGSHGALQRPKVRFTLRLPQNLVPAHPASLTHCPEETTMVAMAAPGFLKACLRIPRFAAVDASRRIVPGQFDEVRAD